MRFSRLKIKEIIKETPDCVSISFDIPAEEKEKFEFKSGQYLTFKQDLNGEEIRRSYSICSAPHENELKVAVKKVEGGKFSTFACNSLSAGDTLESMKPMGRFGSKCEKSGANYLFFAAGSGITPIISIIKDLLNKDASASVTLVYGNKSIENIIFQEELEGLKNRYMGRIRIFYILSREVLSEEIYEGRINKDKCEKIGEKLINFSEFDEAFICGPEEMIHQVKEYLIDAGIDQSMIRFELFTTPGQEKKYTPSETNESILSESGKDVTVIIDGINYSFKLEEEGMNILDRANQAGADLPFACKGGVCCTCRAKLMEGQVKMDVNYSLEEDELERGFVLTCQAHPVTDKVIVNFDIL